MAFVEGRKTNQNNKIFGKRLLTYRITAYVAELKDKRKISWALQIGTILNGCVYQVFEIKGQGYEWI